MKRLAINSYCKSLAIIPLLGFCLMLQPSEYRELLFFNISSFIQGDYWRFYSGHFIYYSFMHLFLNTVALIIFVLLFYSTVTKFIFVEIFLLATIVSCGLLIFSSNLIWYVGFSGVLTGLFVSGAFKLISNDRITAYMILALMTGYTIYQLNSGELADSAIYDISTSTYAHVSGYFGGLFLALCYRVFKSSKIKSM